MQNNNELHEHELQFLRHEISGIYVKLEAYVGLLLLIDKDQLDQLNPDSYNDIRKIKDLIDDLREVLDLYA